MTVTEQIEPMERRLRAAMLNSDLTELDALLADDLLAVGPDGQLVSKADDLAMHRSGQVRIVAIEPVEVTIKPVADTVIVFALMALQVTFEGRPIAGHYRYTRVWTRRAGGWQISAAHISPVPHTQP